MYTKLVVAPPDAAGFIFIGSPVPWLGSVGSLSTDEIAAATKQFAVHSVPCYNLALGVCGLSETATPPVRLSRLELSKVEGLRPALRRTVFHGDARLADAGCIPFQSAG